MRPGRGRSIQRERLEAIARKSDEECERVGYPGGFPACIDVPAARYTDPAFLSLEREHVFERCWLFVAHVDQLPSPGDFLRLDALERLGHPVFLVRAADGTIRALYNACRHRGGPLVDSPSGSTGKRLVCKYHAWTYDLDGQLVARPEAKNFAPGSEAACPPLRQALCETWGPFVFVKLAAGGPTLREHLGPVARELDGVLGDGARGVHFSATRQLEVACNWKAPGDGNIETYHVPFVHRASAGPVLDEQRTGQWLLPQGHSRMLIRFRRPLPEQLPLPRLTGDTALAELGIYSFHVFPNLSVVLGGPSSGFLSATFPDGPDRCLYVVHFFASVARDDETRARVDAGVEGNWAVLLEDLANQTAAQRAMASGALDVLRLQYQERRIRYVHEELDRRIGPERIPAALRVPALLDAFVEES
jgi:phenylpropionate dioxygenase-like ring-hydroxylating dioxygenase large terminal subunit